MFLFLFLFRFPSESNRYIVCFFCFRNRFVPCEYSTLNIHGVSPIDPKSMDCAHLVLQNFVFVMLSSFLPWRIQSSIWTGEENSLVNNLVCWETWFAASKVVVEKHEFLQPLTELEEKRVRFLHCHVLGCSDHFSFVAEFSTNYYLWG